VLRRVVAPPAAIALPGRSNLEPPRQGWRPRRGRRGRPKTRRSARTARARRWAGSSEPAHETDSRRDV